MELKRQWEDLVDERYIESEEEPQVIADNLSTDSIFIKNFFSAHDYIKEILGENVHSEKRSKYAIKKGNFLRPDFSIKIPSDIASKIGLKIGDDVVVSILDENNAELAISKKFTGDEAKKKFTALRESLYNESD